MEKMPYQPGVDVAPVASPAATKRSDWQHRLPLLRGQRVVLRELRIDDAASLCALLSAEDVARFISPPPATLDQFERFIRWTLRQRAAGAYVCFAVTTDAFDAAIGIFQLRRLDAGFALAEWGFAIGSAFWGSGVFEESAELVLDFAFDTIGVRRLEARAAVLNGRGNGALRKIGAVQECLLRRSFARNSAWIDQALYAILDTDRLAHRTRLGSGPRFH